VYKRQVTAAAVVNYRAGLAAGAEPVTRR